MRDGRLKKRGQSPQKYPKVQMRPYVFRPFAPTLLTPPPLPKGILYSPQFRTHQKTKMAARRTQRSTSKI